MIDIELRSRRARVWLDDPPDIHLEVIRYLEFSATCSSSANRKALDIAIELRRNVPGPSSYGLLGAVLTPDTSSQLVIRVPVTSERGPIWTTPLTGRTDTAYQGLPEEYARGVFDEAVESGAALGPGTLTFNWAAHSTIGSSKWFFSSLARILLALLAHDQTTLSKEKLTGIMALPHNGRK